MGREGHGGVGDGSQVGALSSPARVDSQARAGRRQMAGREASRGDPASRSRRRASRRPSSYQLPATRSPDVPCWGHLCRALPSRQHVQGGIWGASAGEAAGQAGPLCLGHEAVPSSHGGGTWEAEVRMAGTVLGVGSALLESSDINHFLEGERAGGPTPDAWGSRFANLHLQACARRSSCRECPAHSSRPFSQHVCSEHLLCTAHSSGHQEDSPDQNSPPPRNP